MKYQEAKTIAQQLTGRTPRWCDVRPDDPEVFFEWDAAPSQDYIALDYEGNAASVERWTNDVPYAPSVAAICYFG